MNSETDRRAARSVWQRRAGDRRLFLHITARTLPDRDAADDCAAATSRAAEDQPAWVAWAELCAAAVEPVDTEALLQAVDARCRQQRTRRRDRQRPRRPAMAWAMAASLLLAVGVGWTASGLVAPRGERITQPGAASVLHHAGAIEPALDDDPALAWEDPLEATLADARSLAWQLESDWDLDDRATDYLWEQIQELDEDLALNTL